MKRKRAGGLPKEPSRTVRGELPGRVLVFLRAVGTDAAIRSAIAAGGYGSHDHEEGQRLLLGICPYQSSGLDPAEDEPARTATSDVEAWARTHLARLKAGVQRLHPEHARLFAAIDAVEGAEAVLDVSRLLERLKKIERSGDASGVLSTLSVRGFGKPQRERLRVLVETARRAVVPRGAAPHTRGPKAVRKVSQRANAEREAVERNLLALHQWFSDWSLTAKTFVTRKDWLIRMGLARKG